MGMIQVGKRVDTGATNVDQTLEATLLLANGSCFRGRGIGVPGVTTGELVFTTAMTGYQEALTDPSYRGQMLLFTYPLIGNYGVESGSAQSSHVQARAAVMATLSSAGAERESLRSYLLSEGMPAIYDVDTRASAQCVRAHGAMSTVLSVHELSLAPDGVVVSNGPGNPAVAAPIVATIQDLYGKAPLLGICLGHQLLALAAGSKTYKLKFGHRGANHPVQDCSTGRAFITTQNHGYAVDPKSLPKDLLVSHRNLNDETVEGLRHRVLPIRSVQFHPEGAPGPRDAGMVLDEWLELVAAASPR